MFSSSFLFNCTFSVVLSLGSLSFFEREMLDCDVNSLFSSCFNETIYLAESVSIGSPPGYAGICANNFVEKKQKEIISSRYLIEWFFINALVSL